jgi:hypothetical protein
MHNPKGKEQKVRKKRLAEGKGYSKASLAESSPRIPAPANNVPTQKLHSPRPPCGYALTADELMQRCVETGSLYRT